MRVLTGSINAIADRMLALLVGTVDAAAACPPESWQEFCYCVRCGTSSPIAYQRTCYVTTTCAVKCTTCVATFLCAC